MASTINIANTVRLAPASIRADIATVFTPSLSWEGGRSNRASVYTTPAPLYQARYFVGCPVLNTLTFTYLSRLGRIEMPLREQLKLPET